jgi:tetratricopeptide (TPR) repeat protein
MDAAVSGRAGVGLLLDGERLLSFDVEEPERLVPRNRSDLNYIFGEASDLKFLEDVTHEEAQAALEREYNSSLGLDLCLVLLDPEHSDAVRTDVATELEDLLADPLVLESLENVMYAAPLPGAADLDGAKRLSRTSGADWTEQFLERLGQSQSAITQVKQAWEAIPMDFFASLEAKLDFTRAGVMAGLFRGLVLAAGDPLGIGKVQIRALKSATINCLRRHREIIQSWTKMLPAAQIALPALVIEREDVDSPQGDKRRPNKGYGRGVILEKIERTKGLIVETMAKKDLAKAWGLVEELVEYQNENGGPAFSVKSLCDLAMEAKNLGLHRFQLELTELATAEKPDDGWSWAQHGDALLNCGRVQEALAAYENARSFGESVIARKGRAEVLKAVGRLPEALEAYESALSEHPEDVFAQNGRADVLKALGRFQEALEAYDGVVSEAPDDAVAQSGRAEVLKVLGRPREALESYDLVIHEHPGDVVALCGRAEVLKALGRLQEALDVYDKLASEHPENVVAKSSRGEVLKALGKLPEALDAYDRVVLEHPENVVAKSGRGEVLKALGKLPEALDAYDRVVLEHPESVVAQRARAEVLKALGRLPEALDDYNRIVAEHPEDVVAKNGRAGVLRALGKLQDSLEAYDLVVLEHPESAVAQSGRAEVLKALGRSDEALDAYDRVLAEHPWDQIAATGRCWVLASLGRFDDALVTLSKRDLSSFADWVAYHIKGVILLRMGRKREAEQIFEDGALNCGWELSREYFKNSLGLLFLHAGNFPAAVDELKQVKLAALQPPANILRLHVFGALGNTKQARDLYNRISSEPNPLDLELTEELGRRYLFGADNLRGYEWIKERELDLQVAISGTAFHLA